jgi:hypothetical protein
MDRPYIIRPQQHNGWSCLNVFLAQITAAQRPDASNGSTAQ